MKPLRDFLVRADISKEYELEVGNKKIFIDPDFNPLHRKVQVGTIHTLPLKYKGNVKVGDICWFHHFVVAPDNCYVVDGKKTYACTPENLFIVKQDGELIPQNEYIFGTQLFEPNENYTTKSGIWLKATPDAIPSTIRLDHVSEGAEKLGFCKGQIIVHQKGVNYIMKIEGKELVKLEAKYIIAERKGFTDYSVVDMHEAKY